MTELPPTETKPGRFRTVKVVLLVVLSAILATVILLAVQANNRVDKIADLACASLAVGATWENVKAEIGDDSLALQVSAAVIEKCPDVAFQG